MSKTAASAVRVRHYLLVTHIPFARTAEGRVVLDGLWARDLQGLVESVGPVRVAAPQLLGAQALRTWGPSAHTLEPGDAGLSFAALPALGRIWNPMSQARLRAVLRSEVARADLVHSSNFFPPYEGLAFAHRLAVGLGKKTLFVITEDFYDMLSWEWVRAAASSQQRRRWQRRLDRLDRLARRCAATASLTLLHTPAVVGRYRLDARNARAIRHPIHDQEDVISQEQLEAKCARILAGDPLVVTAACRHHALKGLDLLLEALALLNRQGVRLQARLYGGGEGHEELRHQVLRLGLGQQVELPGSLSPGKPLYEALARCHLFAMPHRTNDFGRAFFDAMATANPVVAFRTPASIGTLREGIDGLLAPLDDVEGLAEILLRFHLDRPLLVRAATQARLRALTNTRDLWFQLRAQWIDRLFPEKDNL